MIIAIHQPNYIPWIGYFYKMAKCDVFVLLDDALHSKGTITNKNKVKTPNGVSTLIVPLSIKEKKINELIICNDGKWNKKHWRIIHDSYMKAPFFNAYAGFFAQVFNSEFETFCELNITLIKEIRRILGISAKLIVASNLNGDFGKGSERNMNICRHLGGDTYLSGLGARKYNDEAAFKEAGIDLIYSDFVHPVYPQLWGEFVSNLSIIDMLFNCGDKSLEILLGDSEELWGDRN